MGREVRRVPPNWEHPRDERTGEYLSMYDQTYDEAAEEWEREYAEWKAGTHEGLSWGCKYFWEYNGPPPDEDRHRPAFDEPATWYQLYETVSEGSPVTPPFETLEELAHYLCEHGDYHHQWCLRNGSHSVKPTYEQAMAMLKSGSAPSMIVERTGSAVDITGPYGEKK